MFGITRIVYSIVFQIRGQPLNCPQHPVISGFSSGPLSLSVRFPMCKKPDQSHPNGEKPFFKGFFNWTDEGTRTPNPCTLRPALPIVLPGSLSLRTFCLSGLAPAFFYGSGFYARVNLHSSNWHHTNAFLLSERNPYSRVT